VTPAPELPVSCASAEEALALFDRLGAVEPAAMLGAWAGQGFPSGHPLDGVLEDFHWHGKRFDSTEQVRPLVFRASHGRRIQVEAGRLFPFLPLLLRTPALRSPAAGRLFRLLLPLFTTGRSGARLRTMVYRGRASATIVYDRIPVLDVLRCVDSDTVLGLMDLKGMERPFFFLLRRETSFSPGSSPPRS
jgi:hypothetical protein